MVILCKSLAGFGLAALGLVGCVDPAEKPGDSQAGSVNVLFIITDQQRFDALSRARNAELETPNLDQLARTGAYFATAYTPAPICVPARTAILTGHSPKSIGVVRNSDINSKEILSVPSFDGILARAGYHTEYYGKWHAPYRLAATYRNEVRPHSENQGAPADVPTRSEALRRFIDTHVAPRMPVEGEVLHRGLNRPYVPDRLDWHLLIPKAQWPVAIRDSEVANQTRVSGRLDLPREYGRDSLTLRETMDALERIKDRPFSLTCSIDSPHPPFLVGEPYYGMHAPEKLSIPASFNDPLTNSTYRPKKKKRDAFYSDPDVIRRLKANYYGLVRELDDRVGQLLDKLVDLGLERNTLVIFTSDHGEMLGEHGMTGKGVLYEGAVRVPLLMRLPGTIPAGTVVETPVSIIDLFASILDYTGQPGHPSQGRSLRGLIEGTAKAGPDYCVAERPTHFMVRTKRWKLLFSSTPGADRLDGLYNLDEDPHELKNLIGDNPDREQHRAPAEAMKARLISWLEEIESPDLEGVRRRPVVR